jgi:hypothetical protein
MTTTRFYEYFPVVRKGFCGKLPVKEVYVSYEKLLFNQMSYENLLVEVVSYEKLFLSIACMWVIYCNLFAFIFNI